LLLGFKCLALYLVSFWEEGITYFILSKTESGSVKCGGSAEGSSKLVLGEDMQIGRIGSQYSRGSLRDYCSLQILTAKLRS